MPIGPVVLRQSPRTRGCGLARRSEASDRDFLMQSVPQGLAQRFALSFCAGRSGFSLDELRGLFPEYGAQVPVADNRVLSKPDYFCTCLFSLSPGQQRQFLYDLCDSPPPCARQLPSAAERAELLRQLAQADGISPLGVELSSLSLRGVREKWFTAAERVASSPASAVTAARTLLEATCKTVLVERDEVPDSTGDLKRLFKQTVVRLGIDPRSGAGQATFQVSGGLAGCVDGLAGLSNLAGDRHGLSGGKTITDHALSGLAVHAAGTISLLLVQVHRSGNRQARRDGDD